VPFVAYDLLNIDGDPFSVQEYSYGLVLQPSAANSSQYPSCNSIICPPGTAFCPAAYNLWNDMQTLTCRRYRSYTFYLSLEISQITLMEVMQRCLLSLLLDILFYTRMTHFQFRQASWIDFP
jgi:hypothetical protein